jgi:hypothetical protein
MGGVLWKILDSNLFIYFDPIDESKGSKKNPDVDGLDSSGFKTWIYTSWYIKKHFSRL